MKPFLESLHIGAFRGLTNFDISDLKQFNLLVGINNAGKTSVLEAIRLAAVPFDWLNWMTTAQGRDIRGFLGENYPRTELLKWLFQRKTSNREPEIFDGQIHIKAHGEIETIDLGAWATEVRGVPPLRARAVRPWLNQGEPEPEEQTGIALNVKTIGRSGSEQSDSYVFWETGPIDSATPRRSSRVALVLPDTHRLTSRQFASTFSSAIMLNYKEAALSAVRLFDPDVLDIELLSPSGYRDAMPFVQHARVGLSPLNAFGDGFRRTLTMALTLAFVQRGVLLIDEIETALHRDALVTVYRWLVRAARELDVQVIATTHSIEAVDAILEADRNELGDIALFRLSHGPERTSATRFGGDELWRIRNESGMDIR